MAIEVHQNEEISGGGKNRGEKESVLPSVGEERIGIEREKRGGRKFRER